MYFKVGPKEFNEYFSYLIIKHPINKFDREFASSRKVVAEFDSDLHYYSSYVDNDPLTFLSTMREMNFSNYLHPQLSAVCPYNLKGFDTVFRSAIRNNNNNTNQIIIDKFNELNIWEAIIGPYPVNYDYLKKWFDAVNINTELIVDKFLKEDALSHMIKFTSDGMTLSIFLQKIYLISYFLTINKELVCSRDDLIDKFVEFSKSWIDKMEDSFRNKLINGLCKHSKTLIKKFEHLIIENEDISDEKKEDRKDIIELFLSKQGIHQKRHSKILEFVNDNDKTILELGCGSGKFIKFINKSLKNKNIIGLEINSKLARIAKPKYSDKNNIYIKNNSILFPNLEKENLNPDLLVCTEVIEHLEQAERQYLVDLIGKFYIPKKFVITTPNFEYNKLIPGLCDENGKYTGQYRHPDHKIEYTYKQLFEEIIKQLSDNYIVTTYDLFDELQIQPSFIVVGTLRESAKFDFKTQNKKLNIFKSGYYPIYSSISNYEIRSNELETGYSNLAFVRNHKNIFYIGPTMAPVDSNNTFPEYIEHPSSAFQYYSDRKIFDTFAEEKYMGSRGYGLVFKDKDIAKKYNYETDVIINSRGGFTFFENDDLNLLDWKTFQYNMEADYVIFDCEIMPWSYKAKKLIDFDFRVPGECTYLSRKYGMYKSRDSSVDFLNTLKNYSQNTNFEIRIFNILAVGGNNRATVGFHKSRIWHYGVINQLCLNNENIKSVVWYDPNLEDIVPLWEKFTEEGGEGFVIKPNIGWRYTPEGYLIQPALKVRGNKYLQIIYGIDYQEPEYFNKVKQRNIKTKRKMAILQHELSYNILKCWINGNHFQRKKYIAAFFGAESANIGKIDATL